MVRRWRRISEIATVLWASGFRSVVEAAGLHWCVSLRCRLLCSFRRGRCPHAVGGHGAGAQQLVLLLERLGPTYVKLGQLMAGRADYLPTAFAEALRSLQSEVSAFPGALARDIVAAELGAPMESWFDHFEDRPFAAASLSQVHRARTGDGRELAVKVQRPGAAAQVESDLEVLLWIAARLDRRGVTHWGFSPTAAISELAQYTRRELDFRVEARVMAQVADFFSDDDDVVVPAVDTQRSTARVLTMDFVQGTPPQSRSALTAAGLDADRVLATGARAVLRQILELGVFHADPHPGNLLILEGDRVCFLDFGLHGRLDRRERRRIAMMLTALTRGQYDVVADQLLHLSASSRPADLRGFITATGELAAEWFTGGDAQVSVGRLLLGYLGLGGRYGVEFPKDLVLLARSLVHLEATVSVIDPDVPFPRLIGPVVPKISRALLPSRGDLEGVLAEEWMDYVGLLMDLPYLLPHALGRMAEGSAPPLPVRERSGRQVALSALGGAVGGAAVLALFGRLNWTPRKGSF